MKFTFQVADALFDLASEQSASSTTEPAPTFNDSINIISTTRNSLLHHDDENNNNNEKEFQIMTKKLHKICSDEFDAYELEECSTWIGFIQDSLNVALERKRRRNNEGNNVIINDFPDCHAVYVLVTTTKNEESEEEILVAGAVAEIYLEAKASMISYIVTSPQFRGQGLGKKIVQYLAWHMNQICISFSEKNEPLSCLLVDVAQHRDAENEEEKKIAMERQMIWSRLGFSPVEFDMRYPGYLGTARYNVGVYRQSFSKEEEAEEEQQIFLDSKTFLHFLIIMYTSVWEDEVALLKEQKKNNNNTNHEEKEDTSSSLLNPEVLKKTIQRTIDELNEEFRKLPPKLLIHDKFWK